MTVVSNTSPLSNPAIIGQLDLAPEQFGVVLIPPTFSRIARDGAGNTDNTPARNKLFGHNRSLPDSEKEELNITEKSCLARKP